MNPQFKFEYPEGSNELLDRKESARYLKAKFGLPTTPASLATSAVRGDGPRFVHIGRYVRYLKTDLVEWASSRCSGYLDSTSTPHNGNTGGLFRYSPDMGDLPEDFDYRNTGDPRFDEVTRLEEERWNEETIVDEMLEAFDYHKLLNEIKS